jgi:hypothetical protein
MELLWEFMWAPSVREFSTCYRGILLLNEDRLKWRYIYFENKLYVNVLIYFKLIWIFASYFNIIFSIISSITGKRNDCDVLLDWPRWIQECTTWCWCQCLRRPHTDQHVDLHEGILWTSHLFDVMLNWRHTFWRRNIFDVILFRRRTFLTSYLFDVTLYLTSYLFDVALYLTSYLFDVALYLTS